MTAESFTIDLGFPAREGVLVAPGGMATPHGRCVLVDVAGGTAREAREATTGQPVLLVDPQADRIALRYHFDTGSGSYPEAMFTPRDSRFTRAASDLVGDVAGIAPGAAPAERARAIACATAGLFTYGHPELRFNDGHDEVPLLSCGLTEGSCVDINTYFMACLRAAGIETGYATGFFFPAEKGDWCRDGHCWVVTRIDGQTQEWDIAHHLKMGTRDIAPGLNPKPGFRAATFHSMGLDVPEAGLAGLKALIHPVWARDGHAVAVPEDDIAIRLRHPQIAGTGVAR